MTKNEKNKQKKKPFIPAAPGMVFNRLSDENRQWAADNRMKSSEFCVPVRKGKKFGGPEWIRVKCGDGRMGFSTRRKNENDVKIEVGLDGQFKKKRSTLVRHKSATHTASRVARRVDGSKCRLVCLAAITEAAKDPVVATAQKRLANLKNQKRRTLNRRERRDRKRLIEKLQTQAMGMLSVVVR